MDNDALSDLRSRLTASGKLSGTSSLPLSSTDDPLADLRARISNRQNSASAPLPAPIQPAKTFQQSSESPSLLSTFGNGIAKGVAGLADSIPNALVNVANLGIAGYGAAKHELTGSTDLPETLPPDLLSGYSKIGKAVGFINDGNDPTTMPGRIVDAAGQAIGAGGVNPRSIMQSGARILEAPTAFRSYAPLARDIVSPVASGVGAGVGSELTRGVDTGSQALDSAIKVGATFAGGIIPGSITSGMGTAGQRAAAATKGVTQDQIAQAHALAQTAAAQGSPITAYEAIQAVTGLNPKMKLQQRLAEQSDGAATTLTPMMQGRPANNAALMDSVTSGLNNGNAPPVDTTAGALQKAAIDAITAARKDGNAQAQPFYVSTSNDPSNKISASDWNNLSADDGVNAALVSVKNNPYSGLSGVQPGSLQWLDQAKKHLDGSINAQQQAGNNYEAMQMGIARDKILAVADSAFPDYAKARQIISDNMQNVVDPMKNGQIGKLTQSDSMGAQSSALLPNDARGVDPSVLSNTAAIIGQQNPDILRQFLSQDLAEKYNEASQRNMGGENSFGGAKFAANVAGNPSQEDNLNQLLTSSGADPSAFSDAINNFRAQGYRPNSGSETAQNLNEANSWKNLITSPFQTARAFTDSITNGIALDGLSRALSSGSNTVDDIMNLSRQGGQFTPMNNSVISNLQVAPSVSGVSPQDSQNTAPVGIIANARANANSSP